MSTHNICFRREIRKLFTRCPLLSRSMYQHYLHLIKMIWGDSKRLCNEALYSHELNSISSRIQTCDYVGSTKHSTMQTLPVNKQYLHESNSLGQEQGGCISCGDDLK